MLLIVGIVWLMVVGPTAVHPNCAPYTKQAPPVFELNSAKISAVELNDLYPRLFYRIDPRHGRCIRSDTRYINSTLNVTIFCQAAAHRTVQSVHWDAADYNIAFQLQTKDKVIVGYDLSICSREGNRTGMLVVNAAEEFVQHFVGDSIVTFRSDCNCSYAISMLIHFFNDCAVEDCARKVRSLKEGTYKRVIEIVIVCVFVFLCLSFAFIKTRYL